MKATRPTNLDILCTLEHFQNKNKMYTFLPLSVLNPIKTSSNATLALYTSTFKLQQTPGTAVLPPS